MSTAASQPPPSGAARMSTAASQPPPSEAAPQTAPRPAYFKLLEKDDHTLAVEVEEGSGNSFHLGPILRKYTSARLLVRGARRHTVVELAVLFDALGLLRSLQHDVAQFNAVSAIGSGGSAVAAMNAFTLSEIRYGCYRLTRQASAFGVRVPRPGTGTVSVPGLDELIALVEEKYADALTAARTLVKGGLVDFQALGEFYTPGAVLVDRGAATGIFGVPTAMRVRACFYSRGKSLFGVITTFYAAMEFVVSVGDRFAVVEHHFPITEFPGTRSTSEGFDCFIALSEPMRADLLRRGELYARMGTACSFLEYTPGSFLPVPRGGVSRTPARARGGGRVMVDSKAAWARGVHCARSEGTASDAVKGVLKLVAQRARTSAAMTPNVGGDGGGMDSGQLAASEEELSLELLLLSSPLPPGLLVMTWPVVAGFSFQSKSWGVAMVAGLHDVAFNEEAFARLVLPPERKVLIEALVLSHAEGAAAASGGAGAGEDVTGASAPRRGVDVIAGKGEGAIFLLHGPPGVGKTLTAEAIAEVLHKPLYVVSMGELGTTPETLEERLLDILDLCTPWGALVLIDEAEMLLEQRSKNDIIRNAMVCVMLRLLEYYTGILFLTTNRVESLDPAFQSRVQCALRYDALDAARRARVWADLISHATTDVASDVDVAALAAHELNGRQIKNALQLALALSRREGAPLSARHLRATLDLTTAFLTAAGEGSG